MLPLFIDRKLSVALPSVLETIVVLFVFAANVMGELGAFYEKIPIWDSLLHTVNGFICAGVGFGLTDILNRSERVKLSLSPMFVCLFSFCFSMTVGVVWEFLSLVRICFLKRICKGHRNHGNTFGLDFGQAECDNALLPFR